MSRTPKFLLAALALAIVIPLAGCVPSNGQDGVVGSQGPAGETGPKGDKGDTGATGPAGATGATGSRGATGATGASGAAGGAAGPAGPQGIPGVAGSTGGTGPIGLPGSGESAVFYNTNVVAVLPGERFPFDQAGPNTSAGILGDGTGMFSIAQAGIYRVSFTVPNGVGGQLQVKINGALVDYTLVGTNQGDILISLSTLVDVPAVASTLELVNSSGSVFATNTSGSNVASIQIELVKAD